MSKEELLEENKELKTENFLLKEENAQLKKMMFAAKRERFEGSTDATQLDIFGNPSSQQTSEEPLVEKKSSGKKKKALKPKKRNTFPASLKRHTTILLPEQIDQADEMTQIGQDVTELLAYHPASLYVKEIIRPRGIVKADPQSGIVQAAIPPRLIPRGMVDESLVAELVNEKVQFHTPIHRFSKKIKQAGINFISENNLYNWFHTAAESLSAIYDLLIQDILAQGYIQGDETRMPVLSKNKKGAAHRGQMWAFMAPRVKAVAFNYEPTRSTQSAEMVLENYQGILQVDGYSAYEKLAKARPIQLIYCMAHARRNFFEAKDNHPDLANYFLSQLQRLYQIEKDCRTQKRTMEQREAIRKREAVPILKELEKWLSLQSADPKLLPKSLIKKAITYAYSRWQGLSAYARNGELEIDNNLVENTIRPIALGRKNYMFAGSDVGAQNLAILYSIIGTCLQHQLNVQNYLHWLLKKVATHKITPQAIDWLPHRIDPQILEKFRLEQIERMG